jgi:hypothetical protein
MSANLPTETDRRSVEGASGDIRRRRAANRSGVRELTSCIPA